MAQSLIKVSSRALVALRPSSTQRAAGHAEAEREEEDLRAGRAPGSPPRCRREEARDVGCK
eukprot:424965-Pleurochrysis_carterae.AAC.1